MFEKIISGGQTGADRGALDYGLEHKIPIGGYCPKGRRAEDGLIPDIYPLIETPVKSYAYRTEKNVVHSDGTVIITGSPELSPGSKLTRWICKDKKKPFAHLRMSDGEAACTIIFARFIMDHDIKVLNVAGSRESKCPGISAFTKRLLRAGSDVVKLSAKSSNPHHGIRTNSNNGAQTL
jgi:hypothetical protein